ncbi:MAG: TraR/DksA family transcriptional regulator [Acidobacteriota bacterium]
MPKKRLELFRKRLLTKREEIIRNLTQSEEIGKLTDYDDTQDQADKASSAYSKEFLYSLSNSERELLTQIEEALKRIERGSFGYCLSCGTAIGEKRLEALPWAKYCIECQEKIEKSK